MSSFQPDLPPTIVDSKRDGTSRAELPAIGTGQTAGFYAKADEALGGDTVFLAFGDETVIATESDMPIKTGSWIFILPPDGSTYVAVRGSVSVFIIAAKPDATAT